MNNHSVPDFEIDDDYPDIHTSSGVTTSKKSSTMGGVEDIMELIWQDGQVVVQSQNERRHHIIPAAAGEEETSVTLTGPPVFMQDDEMSSWLQYPLDLDDSSFERDIHLLYTATSTSSVTTAEIRPSPLLPSVGTSVPPLSYQLQNFGHFSRLPRALSHSNNINITTSSSSTHTAARASTGVDSNETPKLESMVSRVSDSVTPVLHGGGRTATGSTAAAAETSGATTSGSRSASIEPPPPPAEDRKRKGRETANAQGHAEDVEFESADAKKQASSSTSTKRSRAAEVHNLSERKRRDRINEKMKALQELIPRCNKSDKASMLDEAIEYLKSLQMQVQMMSMGCSMVPMMYPGMPQYMPTMGMGMGMGMRMEMGMNRPIVPYPSLMQGPAMQNAAAVAQMAPRFPIPASYHLPPVPVPDPSRIPATNQPDPMLNSLVRHSSNQPRLPNYSDPYQQYFGLRQSQAVLPQNQGDEQPSSSKPSSCRQGSPGNHQSG